MEEIRISELSGFKIGNAHNPVGATGCTVILCETGATAGVDVRFKTLPAAGGNILGVIEWMEQPCAI